jgi:hypothetical protein
MEKLKGLVKYFVPAYLVGTFIYAIIEIFTGHLLFGVILFALNALNIYMFISNGLRELREQEAEHDHLVH